MGKRKTYSQSYKRKAVLMVVDQGRVSAEVARELGISKNLLYNWKCKYLEDNIEINPKRKGNENNSDYIKKLERENKRLKEERDILKKAAIFFANDP
jgi:transposase